MFDGHSGEAMEERSNLKGGAFPEEIWVSLGEDFRNLRTKIFDNLREERHKLILVTSAAPKEGKTMVATNLARAMAEASWKTLLIDADMRSPGVHSLFGIDLSPGLGEVLKEKSLNVRYCRATDISGLGILPAGRPAGNPVEQIDSAFMPLLMNDCRSRYDYVVIDTPPLLPLADTAALSRLADGILLVIKGEATPREVTRSALDQLGDRPIMGVVLNGIKKPNKYYNYYY